jgi:exopolyphosphatase/guanosine-5'-triphosphate,3'-diphosphate pyrophosphatase
MRLAAIDIGTNSIKMTLGDVASSGEVSVVTELSEVTRLGAGVDASKHLQEEAAARTLAAIQRFAERARAEGAVKIVAVGTSALRDADNGSEFIAQAKIQAAVEIQIISGEREAHLSYRAVFSDPTLPVDPAAPLLVCDIGGGSTELIQGQGQDVHAFLSLDIGAVRLTERFFPDGSVPTEAQIQDAAQWINEWLDRFPSSDQPMQMVGIGGTIINLASVIQTLPKTDPKAVHGSWLADTEVHAALTHLQALPLEQRRQVPGLEPDRADVIVGGALILSCLLTHFQVPQIAVSARGVRYGLLAETAQK